MKEGRGGRFLYRLEELELDGTKEWCRALVGETVPELSAVLKPPGKLEFSYATIPGWDYEIQVSDTSPIESLPWESLPMSSSFDWTASVEVLGASERAFFRLQAIKRGLD